MDTNGGAGILQPDRSVLDAILTRCAGHLELLFEALVMVYFPSIFIPTREVYLEWI